MRSLYKKARQSDVEIGTLARKLFNAISAGFAAGKGNYGTTSEHSARFELILEDLGLSEELQKFGHLEVRFDISLSPERKKGSYSRGGEYVTRPFQAILMNIQFSRGDFDNIYHLMSRYSISQIINIPFFRDAFLHELVHFMDEEAHDLWGKIREPKDSKDYFNSPHEILARIHQFTTVVIHSLYAEPGARERLKDPRVFMEEVFKVIKNDDPEFLEHVSPENLKRVKKWLYTFHADVVMPRIERLGSNSMIKLKQAALLLKGQAETLTFEQALAEIEQMAETSGIALHQVGPESFKQQEGRVLAFEEVLEVLRKVK